MKQIQFRLLDENNKIVGYERWYVGSFNMETKKDYYVAKPCWMYSKDLKYWNPDKIDHRYKEQFTGLQDKNGKEIFEGDIIHTFHFDKRGYKSTVEKGIVKFDEGSWKYFNNNGDWDLNYHVTDYSCAEIIGNIHENPELLENK